MQVTGVTYLAGGAEEVTHLTRGPHGKEATHPVGGVSNKLLHLLQEVYYLLCMNTY